MAASNFRQLLNLFPESSAFTCVGTTKQKYRCCNRINQADLAQAGRVLDRLSNRNIYNEAFIEELQPLMLELARLILCRRWHRDRIPQGPYISAYWLQILSDYRLNMIVPRQIGGPQLLGPVEYSALSHRPTDVTTSSRYPSNSFRSLRHTQRASSVDFILSSPGRQSLTRVSIHTSTQIEISQTVQTYSAESNVAAPPSLPQPPEITVPRPATAQMPTSVNRHPTRVILTGPPTGTRRVSRRPLSDCYACLEPIDRLEDAVWCRSTCGQNICTECFEHWRISQIRHMRPVTCGFWYISLQFFSHVIIIVINLLIHCTIAVHLGLDVALLLIYGTVCKNCMTFKLTT